MQTVGATAIKPVTLDVNGANVTQVLYNVSFELNGTTFNQGAPYYITVIAENSAGTGNITSNATVVMHPIPLPLSIRLSSLCARHLPPFQIGILLLGGHRH